MPLYKASSYNTWFDYENKMLCYNGYASGFALLDKDDYKLYKNIVQDDFDLDLLTNEDKQKAMQIINGNLVVPRELDEVSLIKLKFNEASFSRNFLGMTILPTLDCNCNCKYCFEEHQKIRMTDDVADKLKEFTKYWVDTYSVKGLHIGWFGGEPLLEKDRVLELANFFFDLSTSNKISFSSSMISNCLLLTPEYAKELVKLGINQIQATIDGTKVQHDSRRVLKGGQGTFDKIKKVIIECSPYIKFAIRINLDREVSDCIGQVFDELKDIYHQNVGFYPGMLNGDATKACSSIENTCLDTKEFALVTTKFYQELTKRNLPMNWYVRSSSTCCTATRVGAMVVCPDGSLCRCWNQVGVIEESYGNIMNTQYKTENYFKWVLFNPFNDDECIKCSFLPICLGGCPAKTVPSNSEFLSTTKKRERCTSLRYNLEEQLILLYEDIKKRQASEKRDILDNGRLE